MNAEQLLRSKGLWGMDDDINELYCTILEDIHLWAKKLSIQKSVNVFFSSFQFMELEEDEKKFDYFTEVFHWTPHEIAVAMDLAKELIDDIVFYVDTDNE